MNNFEQEITFSESKNNEFVVERKITFTNSIFEKCQACEKINSHYNKIPKCHLCVREWRKELREK